MLLVIYVQFLEFLSK